MKKTLVALAALATVGAAFAQSTVTLYGKIDWEIQSLTGRDATGANISPGLRVQSAGLAGSRFGMKGSEDLGGGMSAIFDLQSGFSVDTGVMGQSTAGATPRIFGRQAYAGLKGGWGQFTAGRQYSPYDNAFGNVDAQGYTSNSAMGSVFAAGGHSDIGRFDNSLTYFTPAMGGFSAQVMYAPGENKTPAVSASRYTGLGLGYANGPVNVQFAAENSKGVGATGTTNGYILGGSYNFGVATGYVAFERATTAANTTDKGYSFGASLPIGIATLSAGYARETSNPAVGASSVSRGFGGQITYPLSKRTLVYTEVLSTRNSVTGSAITATTQTFGVGMQHNF